MITPSPYEHGSLVSRIAQENINPFSGASLGNPYEGSPWLIS